MAKRDELVDLTDGTDVQYLGDAPYSYRLWDGKTMETFQGREVRKAFMASKEFVECGFDDRNRRVFSAPQWYWEKIGLV